MQHYQTKRQVALALLRNAIIAGDLPPGTRLALDTLTRSYGLSMTPLREALPILEAEGFITQSPHKGVVVSAMDREEIMELYTMRWAMEALATRHAILRLTDADLAAMEGKCQELEVFEGDWEAFLTIDKQLHTILYRAAGSDRWVSTIEVLWLRSTRYMLASTAAVGAVERIHQDHRRLLYACQQRDIAQAEATIHDHLSYAEHSLLSSWP